MNSDKKEREDLLKAQAIQASAIGPVSTSAMEAELEALRSQVKKLQDNEKRDRSAEVMAAMFSMDRSDFDTEERDYIDILMAKLAGHATQLGWSFAAIREGDWDAVFTKGRKSIYAKFDFDVGELYSAQRITELVGEIELFDAFK